MATILLSAAGAAIGSGFGGTVLGLSGSVIGRAVGATVGRKIDQKLLGRGGEAVEVGRTERFHVSAPAEGSALTEVWGRVRLAGEVIWASKFLETTTRTGGGKGAPRQPATKSFSYSVSLAIGLCRGEASGIDRIWADGIEIAVSSLDLRFYPGSEDQLPDPKIEAVEGFGNAPAYRGMAYVVIENLNLGKFGNRVPQFSFEVIRQSPTAVEDRSNLASIIRSVAMIPGTGEYALATTPVHFNFGPGSNRWANMNTVQEETDFAVSLKQLDTELPNCKGVSLVVSWFGDDLRCASCSIQPLVEQKLQDAVEMPWYVSGISRAQAGEVPRFSGRPVYGGTPTDKSVVEAIQTMRLDGKDVMFYPFILMEQMEGNGRPDPWTGAPNQPVLPWRGRISLSIAPGSPGTPNGTVVARQQVEDFLGTASIADFSIIAGKVVYSGAQDWGYRRFILHNAFLCALAGGVESFCVGSELRGLTQIRDHENRFPMVEALITLAGEVKAILGTNTKVSYAADWSEYFGTHDGDNVFFNLDPLWADPNIDFIGIDNYMPLSDWRNSPDNLDQSWGSVYDIEYLKANILGGEGFDWFYATSDDADKQIRSTIVDTAHGEDWVFRYKDITGWWSNSHYNRIAGVRDAVPTAWLPQSKPIRFTEYGCPALNNGTNQPNKFLDAKSSESSLPRGSNGFRDDFIQMQYYRAIEEFWTQSENNPTSAVFGGRMLDMVHCYAWAWDGRPFPEFPGNELVWSDGENYDRGHWLNGRVSSQPSSAIVSDIVRDSAMDRSQLSVSNIGLSRGFQSTSLDSHRSKLQSLSLVNQFEIYQIGNQISVRNRTGDARLVLDRGFLVSDQAEDQGFELSRDSALDQIGAVRLTHVIAEGDYEASTAEVISPFRQKLGHSEFEYSGVLTAAEASLIGERWLAEVNLAKNAVSFGLPPSLGYLELGDVVEFENLRYRIDRVESGYFLKAEGVQVDPASYSSGGELPALRFRNVPSIPTPVFAVFLDLPILRGDEIPFTPHIAVAANPWPGDVAIWSSSGDAGYTLAGLTGVPAVIGLSENDLLAAPPGVWDVASRLLVRIASGELSSRSDLDVLNGANVVAIGSGSGGAWEVLQFANAVLISEGLYELSRFLRGQAGTDATMPSSWPQGSLVVVLDEFVPQISLSSSTRGIVRNYRVGPAERGYANTSISSQVIAFEGVGLRPLSVSHLSMAGQDNGDLRFDWIRRTRIDGDTWASAEVPLGEEAEIYVVKILIGQAEVRSVEVTQPSWTYSSTLQLTDGVASGFRVTVAQRSVAFGVGPARSISVSL